MRRYEMMVIVTDTVEEVPGLKEAPVLGTLFRSTEFEHEETELVIIVTPYLVKPAPADALVTPVDNFVPPSEFDLWWKGYTEDPRSGGDVPGGVLGGNSAGGITGPYGHIIQ